MEIGREGLFLSLEGAPLAALRGLYVPWGVHRAEVLAQIAYYVPGNRIGGDVRVGLASPSATHSTAKTDSAMSQAAGEQE